MPIRNGCAYTSSSQRCSRTPILTARQVFAVVVGSMSAITALVFGIISIFAQYRAIAMLFAWEWILVILWAAVSGLFGSMYFDEKTEMDHGIKSMKTAAAFDM